MKIKFTSTELVVFNMILTGCSRDDIVAAKIVAPSSLPSVLSEIYKKTEHIVKYHTAKDKFAELLCYIRNNPDEFKNYPVTNVKPKSNKPKRSIVKETNTTKQESEINSITAKITKILDNFDKQIHNSQEILNAKYCLLDDIYKEFNNAGLIVRE